VKVLWVTERFPPQRGGVAGAAGRQVELLAPHLERLDVLHLDSGLPAAWVDSCERGGAHVHRLGRADASEDSLHLLFEAAVELARAEGHDLVHGFYATFAGYVAVLASRRLGRPSLVSLRGNDVDRGIFQGSRAFFLRFALEHATAIAVVARDLADKVRAFGGRSDELHWIPNSVDCELFSPPRADFEPPPELGRQPRPWLGFAGELRFKKGLPLLLELAEHLQADGRGTLFVIGGVRADERDRVESWRLRQPQAAARLVELPYTRDREQLVDSYRAMDLMVFPSFWDGLPNAALEAMACARPVVATATGGLADVLEDGRTGFLVPPGELGRLTAVVDGVLDLEPAEREAVGSAARQWVGEHAAPERERRALLELYRRLV
jgi:glycosyltransferase involved in cell wall biosynthesis